MEQLQSAWSGNTGTATLGGLSFTGLTDPTNSSTDSIYAGGVKQDTTCPAVTTGNVNDKADLGRIYIASESLNGHVYLFLGWERQIDTTINSDVFISFEFNQGKLACANKTGFVQRTKGDLLFDYNFQSGNSTINANEWDGSTWKSLQTPPFEAAVNSGTVTDSIGPGGSVSLTKFEFGEAGIDLSALDLTGNGGKACETFGNVLGGSRTSKSGTSAQLKDYVGPAPIDVSNCVQPTVATTLKNAAGNVTIANNSAVASRLERLRHGNAGESRQRQGADGNRHLHVLHERGLHRHRDLGRHRDARIGRRAAVRHRGSAVSGELQLPRAVQLRQRSELHGLRAERM